MSEGAISTTEYIQPKGRPIFIEKKICILILFIWWAAFFLTNTFIFDKDTIVKKFTKDLFHEDGTPLSENKKHIVKQKGKKNKSQ